MARKVSDGRSVKVTVPTGVTVEAGKFCLIQGFFGLAVDHANAGEKVVLNVEQGEYETSQINTADAFNVGDKVFWDATNNRLTTNANNDASGNPQNRPVGRVTQAKDNNNVIWFVLGPQVQAHA
jgi:predicted RecA/RadA family phage recombinase